MNCKPKHKTLRAANGFGFNPYSNPFDVQPGMPGMVPQMAQNNAATQFAASAHPWAVEDRNNAQQAVKFGQGMQTQQLGLQTGQQNFNQGLQANAQTFNQGLTNRQFDASRLDNQFNQGLQRDLFGLQSKAQDFSQGMQTKQFVASRQDKALDNDYRARREQRQVMDFNRAQNTMSQPLRSMTPYRLRDGGEIHAAMGFGSEGYTDRYGTRWMSPRDGVEFENKQRLAELQIAEKEAALGLGGVARPVGQQPVLEQAGVPRRGLRMRDGGVWGALKSAVGMGESDAEYSARIDAASGKQAPGSLATAHAARLKSEGGTWGNVGGGSARPAPTKASYDGVSMQTKRGLRDVGELRDGGTLQTGMGGDVPGTGKGDKIPAKYEPGEFVASNDMLDAEPGLREHLRTLREQVLAEKGMTVAEADAKAVGKGRGLRAEGGGTWLDAERADTARLDPMVQKIAEKAAAEARAKAILDTSVDTPEGRSDSARGETTRSAPTPNVVVAPTTKTQAATTEDIGVSDPFGAVAPKPAPKPVAPSAVTQGERLASDQLTNSVMSRGLRRAGEPTNADINLQRLNSDPAARDTYNAALGLRGAGIQVMPGGESHGPIFTNSTGPEKLRYTGADGAPTNDWAQTKDYRESIGRTAKLTALGDKLENERGRREMQQQEGAMTDAAMNGDARAAALLPGLRSLRGEMEKNNAGIKVAEINRQAELERAQAPARLAELERQRNADIFAAAGNDPVKAAELAARVGRDPKQYSDMVSVAQGQVKARNDIEGTAQKLIRDRIAGTLPSSGDPKADEAFADRIANTIITNNPKVALLNPEQLAEVLPGLRAKATLLERFRSPQESGYESWLPDAMAGRSAPDRMSQLPPPEFFKGAKLEEKASGLRGAFTPGGLEKGDFVLNLPGHKNMNMGKLDDTERNELMKLINAANGKAR